MYSFYHDYHVVVIFSYHVVSSQVRHVIKLTPKIMYEISAHFMTHLRIATLSQSTHTATAAMSAAPEGSKKTKSRLLLIIQQF